jgi:hypothetical protein
LSLLVPLAKGIATYIPGLYRPASGSTGGTVSARYCYSVWMRHFTLAHGTGALDSIATVAELGPGDSLGIGLSALLSGAETYFAFDVVPYANNERNVGILAELAELFRARTPIPGDDEFPYIRPKLEDYRFPEALLPADTLERSIAPLRLEQIRRALAGQDSPITIRYKVPWDSPEMLQDGRIDFLFSQAVLEHVADLDATYGAMARWLKPTGVMSHQVDLSAHYLFKRWNQHWTCSDLTWKLILGRRPFLINREPLESHLSLLRRHGFEVLREARFSRTSDVSRRELAARFRDLGEESLNTSGLFVIARHSGR